MATVSEHAANIWPFLIEAAQNRRVLTYADVGKSCEILPWFLGRYLEPIQSFCLLKKLPPLTVLVVRKDTGRPGEGFKAAKDIQLKQDEVFAFDWRSIKTPTPQQLRDAVDLLPSCNNPAALDQAKQFW